jgi:sporulation protein YlmC with PRC-barrel domain
MKTTRLNAAAAIMVIAAGSAVTLGAWQNQAQQGSRTTPQNQNHTQGQGTPLNQNQGVNQNQGKNPNMAQRGTSMYAADYRSYSQLSGADIYDWNDDDVGEVSDLLIDRGSGKITHVVVKSGTVLGMGGRSVLVPFREFQWDAGRDRLVLGTQRLSDYPVYTPESWTGLRGSSRPTSMRDEDRRNRGMGEQGNQQPMPSRHTGSGIGDPRNDLPPGQNSTTGTNTATGGSTTGNTGATGTGTAGSGTNRDPNTRTNTGTGTSDNTNRDNANRDNTNRDNTNRGADQPRAQDTGEGNTRSQPNTHTTPGTDPNRGTMQNDRDRNRDWTRSADRGEPPTLNDWMWGQPGFRQGNDPYSSQWTTASKQRIEGEVKRVDRQYVSGQGEQVVLEVAANDGTTKRVAVGPSWYVTGGEQSFTRGDKVTIEAMPVFVATSAQINGKSYTYRTDEGKTAWQDDTFRSGDQSYSAPYYRNALVSQVRGAKIDCRGVACGTIDDVIIDMESGMAAFLSIDPDDNFLGIGDTKRLAPWTVASIGADGRIRIDAAKEMMLQTTPTPSDLTTLNQPGTTDAIYNAYQVPARDYNRWRDDSDMDNNDSWRRDRDDWRRNRGTDATGTNRDPNRGTGTNDATNPNRPGGQQPR